MRRFRRARRAHGDRGVTLVGYALILSLMVITASGGIFFFQEVSEAEVNKQADCVSMRPPPTTCQIRTVAPPTTSGGGGGGGGGGGTPIPTPVTVSVPSSAVTPILVLAWGGEVEFSVVDDLGAPVEGAIVRVTVKTQFSTDVEVCDTDAAGLCPINRIMIGTDLFVDMQVEEFGGGDGDQLLELTNSVVTRLHRDGTLEYDPPGGPFA